MTIPRKSTNIFQSVSRPSVDFVSPCKTAHQKLHKHRKRNLTVTSKEQALADQERFEMLKSMNIVPHNLSNQTQRKASIYKIARENSCHQRIHVHGTRVLKLLTDVCTEFESSSESESSSNGTISSESSVYSDMVPIAPAPKVLVNPNLDVRLKEGFVFIGGSWGSVNISDVISSRPQNSFPKIACTTDASNSIV